MLIDVFDPDSNWNVSPMDTGNYIHNAGVSEYELSRILTDMDTRELNGRGIAGYA